MKLTKMQREKASKLLAEIDGLRDYRPDHYSRRFFSVNVKLYGQEVPEPEELAEKYPKRYRERIIEEFTPEHIGELIDDEIRFEADYWATDVIDGCRNNSAKYYDELEIEIRAGKKTNYPYLDEKKTIKERLAEMNEWREKDATELYYLSMIDKNTVGFYGRMGGHYCFDINNDVEEALYEMESEREWDIYGTPEEILDEAEKMLKAVYWLKAEVADAHAYILKKEWAMNVLEGSVDNFVDDLAEEDKKESEIKRAKKLAEKYGYILAKEIK